MNRLAAALAFSLMLFGPIGGAIGLTNADELKLPPGTRKDPETGALVSSRGLRDTTDAVAKEIARLGIAAKQIGPYRVRGVELARFVSQSPATSWIAIHILRSAGKTVIFFVPRSGS